MVVHAIAARGRAIAAVASSLMLATSAIPSADPCWLTVAQGAADARTELGPSRLSADGRFLAFAARAPLIPSATGAHAKIYVLDLATRVLTMESPPPDESGWSVDSLAPSISGDGRFLVFEWRGGTSDTGVPTGHAQILLRDRHLGTTRLISVNKNHVRGNESSGNAVISADGRIVAFESHATNLVAGNDLNGVTSDIYVADIATGNLSRASVDLWGAQRDDPSVSPAISGDGRYVAFASAARLDEPSTRGDGSSARPRARTSLVFVRDLVTGVTSRVSRRPGGGEPNGPSFFPSISADGRWVAFVSNATDIAAGTRNRVSNIYLQDLRTSTTTLVSRGSDGQPGNGASTRPTLSGNGRFVAFESNASNLVCGKTCAPADQDINLLSDVFVFDRAERSIVRLSADAQSGWIEASASASLDGSGGTIAFSSRHPIGRDDVLNDYDLFVSTCCR